MKINKEILSYYLSSRGIGHTKAISEIENVLIIVGDKMSFEGMFKSKCVRLSDFDKKTRGLKVPLVFDNSAIVQLMQDN